MVADNDSGAAPSSPASLEGPSPVGPLRMTVVKGRYKSIRPPLDWSDIPPLAILTGVNGSGKTQLLEAIELAFHPYQRTQLQNTDLELSTSGSAYKQQEVLFLQDMSKTKNVLSGYSRLEEQVKNAQGRSRTPNNPHEEIVVNALKKFRISHPSELDPTALLTLFYANPNLLERAVANHFAAYVLAFANCLLASPHADRGKCRKSLGPAPWEELNQVLALATFPYRLVEPQKLMIGQQSGLRVRHVESNNEMSISDLSSGEATIINFLLFTFAARQQSFGLKLLLLDEPDAHLHTSLIHMFLSILRELVQGYGCRVIMITHRIETIALAPEEALFVMHREVPRIRKSDAKARTVTMLTSNLVGIVMAGRRPVFVEDVVDAEFYRTAVAILREEKHWGAAVLPDFIPSSTWVSKLKQPGGAERVKQMVATLRNAGVGEVVAGIIDRDAGNEAEDGVVVLDRYAIENYLIDPINVFALLLDGGNAPFVELETPVVLGEEGKIRERSDEELQRIADAVTELFEARIDPPASEEEKERTTVEYTNGRRITIPLWLVERRGHDLMHSLRAITPRVSSNELTKAVLKVRLIPQSLRNLLLQTVGHVD
jgi:energy-coupling factor transporter ATP-binding protein EcfA2